MEKVLILGGTGMLGHSLFHLLADDGRWQVQATVRDWGDLPPDFPDRLARRVVPGVDAGQFDSVIRAFAEIRPDIVINAIGLVKQGGRADDPLQAITLNAQLPHRLAHLCRVCGARLIQISTDCVFDGRRGNYKEEDSCAPPDLYGRSKLLGEVAYPGCLTLRTSIIGHELRNSQGLLEWFLAQEGRVRGFSRAFFSGFPTVEIARVLAKFVLPDRELEGVFHLSSARISKYDLLRLVANRYKKRVEVECEEGFQIDRSLDSSHFRTRTGYVPPDWEELVAMMHSDFMSSPLYAQRRLKAERN